MTLKKKEKVMNVSVTTWCYSVDIMLHYMRQTGFEYSDINSFQKNSCCHEKFKQFTKTSDYYKLFLKISFSCVKKGCKVLCEVL